MPATACGDHRDARLGHGRKFRRDIRSAHAARRHADLARLSARDLHPPHPDARRSGTTASGSRTCPTDAPRRSTPRCLRFAWRFPAESRPQISASLERYGRHLQVFRLAQRSRRRRVRARAGTGELNHAQGPGHGQFRVGQVHLRACAGREDRPAGHAYRPDLLASGMGPGAEPASTLRGSTRCWRVTHGSSTARIHRPSTGACRAPIRSSG